MLFRITCIFLIAGVDEKNETVTCIFIYFENVTVLWNNDRVVNYKTYWIWEQSITCISLLQQVVAQVILQFTAKC